MSKHYTWIDYAKFLTIFLVIYIHCYPELPEFGGFSMILLRMPCFFFISGLLFRPDKYPTIKKFAIHRSKQLLVPYFCFSLIFYFVWLIIGRQIGDDMHNSLPLYQPLLKRILGITGAGNSPLWFLLLLFIVQCTFYLLIKNLSKKIVGIILLLLPIIPVFINLSGTPYSLDKICYYLPFYGIASLYRKEIMKFMTKKKRYITGIICLLIHIVLVLCFIHTINPLIRLPLKIFGSFTIIFTFLIAVKIIADVAGKQKFIEYVTNNAVVVLAFHCYAIRIFDLLMIHILHFHEDYFGGNNYLKLVLAIISMASMTIPIYVINKYFPFLVGKGHLFEKRGIAGK